jgi:hypothetical protein
MKAAGLGVLLVIVACPLTLMASLGSNIASVENDRAQMKGTVQVRQASGYAVHEISSTEGTRVREFVSPSGTVFGVAWQGPFSPDMRQLLGDHFSEYEAGVKAAKSSYVGRRPLDLRLPGLVVQKNGHMRAYNGRAYIPGQVPAGVKVEELW